MVDSEGNGESWKSLEERNAEIREVLPGDF